MDTINSALYIEDEALKDYAAAAAQLFRPQGDCSGSAAAKKLRQDYRDIRRCHEEAVKRYGELSSPPVHWEWLMDNWYMVQREYQAALPAIERARGLRRCSDGTLVIALCRSMLLAGQGRLTEERLGIYLEGFESVRPLKMAELELLPAALSAAVIARIAELCLALRLGSDNEEAAGKGFEALFGSLRLFAVLDMEKVQ